MKHFLIELAEISQKETLPLFRSAIFVDNKQAVSGNFDPVTAADRQAEKAIREMISARFPQDAIFGEEFGTANEGAHNGWIIDPIDGTRAFITGIPLWGTLVGRFEAGKMTAGILSQPYIEETIVAADGDCCLIRGGVETKLQTSATSELEQAKLMTTSPRIFAPDLAPKYDALEEQCLLARYGGDCYAYGLLAMGSVDLVCEAGLQNYDIAPLIPIIEMAGGVVTTWSGQTAINGGNVLASANQQLHEKALAALNCV